MDRITESLLQEFVIDQSLGKLQTSVAFERFANFCVISSQYTETFSVEDVSSGSGNDCGLDGIAVILNGILVTSDDEVRDIVEANRYADATFVFVQAKTASSFSGSEIGTFLYGAKDFFSDAGSLVRNDFVKQSVAVQQEIYKLSARMTKGKPACKLFYVTTGKWTDDANLVGRYQAGVKDMEELGIFRSVDFTPVDADYLYRLYQQSKNKVTADFNFPQKTVIPDIPGVAEAYIGMIPAKEYISLITDPSGRMRKTLFYDNVRDFLDYNPVNSDMKQTLQSDEEKSWFALLNNGVTIIAKSLRTVGNKFHIEDYQVVNGCQTSHVLFDEEDNLGPTVFVPLKVIATTDDKVTNAIIKATNHQTEVKAEQLYALSDFQKNLEAFFVT